MGKPTRKKYTPKFKAKVLAFAAANGVAAAERKFKVGNSNIYGWQGRVTGKKPATAAKPIPIRETIALLKLAVQSSGRKAAVLAELALLTLEGK